MAADPGPGPNSSFVIGWHVRILLAGLKRDNITNRAPNLQYDLTEDIAAYLVAQGTCREVEQVRVQAANFITEQDAVVVNTALALWEEDARWPKIPT